MGVMGAMRVKGAGDLGAGHPTRGPMRAPTEEPARATPGNPFLYGTFALPGSHSRPLGGKSAHMRYPYFFLSLLTGSLFLAAASCSSDSDSNGGGTGGSGATPSTGGADSGAGGSDGGTGGTSSNADTFFSADDAGLSIGLGAYNYFDMGGSTIALTNPEPGKLCAKGTAAQVVNMMYSEIWGGGIGVLLAEDGMTFDASQYDGFSFDIAGVPAGELRVGVTNASDTENGFFTNDISEGTNTLHWDDLAQGDWVTPAGTLELSAIKDLQFQVASNDGGDVPFDFCISNIAFIGGNDGMGGMGGGN